MNNLVDRIFKNWKTTAVGMLIILSALVAVFLNKATLTEAGTFIVMGIGFFFLKDKQLPPAAIFIVAMLLSACSASHHLRRAAYHTRMAQAKGAIVKADTIYKTIPIITETKVYDTVVQHQNHYDTLTITNTRWQVKLKYDTVMRTQYVQVQCKGDTIYKEVPVSVPVTITERPRVGIVWVILLLLAAMVVITVMNRR